MNVVAKHRFARISPQKCRLIADMVRGQKVSSASNTLKFMPNKGAKLLKKVLDSAVANAEHNHGADIDELKISRVFVDQAPTFKRLRPRMKGRADRILKRNSHITVEVSDEQ